MNQIDISASLTKIEVFWVNLTKENSDDTDVYDYIATQSVALKMIVFQLNDRIENQMLKDKKAKLKLQKLHKALSNILNKLDFRVRVDKDKEYIEDILSKLLETKEDIEIIKQYR